ncbi:MAG: hypothetical protein MMC33_000660 [Icmadophila ericetorum]|nr:hypothetical protein [Icmadophila ericetorum]
MSADGRDTQPESSSRMATKHEDAVESKRENGPTSLTASMALIGPGAGRRNAATSELAIDAGGNMATMGDWDT